MDQVGSFAAYESGRQRVAELSRDLERRRSLQERGATAPRAHHLHAVRARIGRWLHHRPMEAGRSADTAHA